MSLDCVIIGGGPAGLTAALYLARFGRTFALIDAGESRAAWIPESHTLPLFADGMNGKRMLAMMRAHLERYSVSPQRATVTALAPQRGGFAVTIADNTVLHAPAVLMATGALDCPPGIPALEQAVQRGLVRYCPICDGYEARGKTIAVIAQGGENTEHGLREALFLARGFGARVSLLAVGQPMHLTAEARARASQNGVALIADPVTSLEIRESGIACLCSGGDGCHVFDTAYAALGLHVRSGFATALGARREDSGALIVDSHSETSVRGLFAAGDVTAGLDQIVVAMGQAAAAATAIHSRCPHPSVAMAG